MRRELCHMCGLWIVVDRADWDEIREAVRRHNKTLLHGQARERREAAA